MNQDAANGIAIVESIDDIIRTIYQDHVSKQRLWMPAELLPEDFKVQPLPPAIKAMLILNLLTEDGLPYFFGLLVKHLGDRHSIFDWIKIWTGEEFRHGHALQLFLNKILNREQLIMVGHMQYNYLSVGFWPDWGSDPVKLLAYVVLQEQATKVSHLGIAKAATEHDPVLNSLMKKIAAEEAKHHLAYLAMFKACLKADPNHSLKALLHVIRNFTMPGNGISGFSILSEVQARAGVFGPAQLAEVISEVAVKLDLVNLPGLDAVGEKARDDIFASLKTLQRIAGRIVREKTIALPGFGEEFVFTL